VHRRDGEEQVSAVQGEGLEGGGGWVVGGFTNNIFIPILDPWILACLMSKKWESMWQENAQRMLMGVSLAAQRSSTCGQAMHVGMLPTNQTCQ
jgi:hypothetical protein